MQGGNGYSAESSISRRPKNCQGTPSRGSMSSLAQARVQYQRWEVPGLWRCDQGGCLHRRSSGH